MGVPKVLDHNMIRKIRFKWYMFNLMSLILVINQMTHEVLDPSVKERAKGDK